MVTAVPPQQAKSRLAGDPSAEDPHENEGVRFMTLSPYERFAVRTPIRRELYPDAKGRQGLALTYLSGRQVPEANFYLELSWIYDVSQPHRHMSQRVLDHDQLLLHIGMDPNTPQELGGTVAFYLDGQAIVFNTTTTVFIPRGTPYGPLTWKEIRRPHVQLSMVFGNGDPSSGLDRRAVENGTCVPEKTRNFDFEQYVIRSPMREAGPTCVEGRQNPTMTYLSRRQINSVNHYIEFGWIWGVPDPQLPRMRHDGFDEIVLHLGSDPDDPEDLGGSLQFGVGEDLLEFDTTHCIYAPRGMDHGPAIWKEVRRPLIELAMMLGAGTLEEGWANSFFDQPDGSRRGPK
jgi:hypothetical protein